MPKKIHKNSDEPTSKKMKVEDSNFKSVELKPGEVLEDLQGKKWILGKNIGFGGFGVIHEVSESSSVQNNKYVVKIEPHSNGPLFSEINCYLRIARKKMIEDWMIKKNLLFLGMPHYVASGSHVFNGVKYRFLVIPHYKKDLEAILEEKKKFNLKTVLLISRHILQVLEYIHEKGYIHSDIKAANIMLDSVKTSKSIKTSDLSTNSETADPKRSFREVRTCRLRKTPKLPVLPKLKPYRTRNVKCVDYNEDNIFPFVDLDYNFQPPKVESDNIESEKTDSISRDQLYLLDFGLASKYKLSTGELKQCGDERKAHAGTLLFCSRDAHKGIQSRRSDLESLAYNMVYWLTGSLPWIEDLDDPEMTQRKKRHCFVDISGFLYFCMADPPRILKELFQYVKGLDVQDGINYNACKQYIDKALNEHGYYDQNFDFDNLEGWGLSKKKNINKLNPPVDAFKRPPLLSNMPVKPILRKKTKKKTQAALKWSMMLSNPEVLLKKIRDKKPEAIDIPTVLDFDIEGMNPTPAMREVFKRYEERKGLSPNHDEENYVGDSPEGYTPAMLAVKQKMLEEKEIEETVKSIKKKKKTKTSNGKKVRRTKQKTPLPRRTYRLRG